MPLTLEISPVLECNAACPDCPYARPRRNAGLGLIAQGAFASSTSDTVATEQTVEIFLAKARAAGVRGVLWTGGGEPTIWQPLPQLIRRSAELGMVNALYTNGIMLGLCDRTVEYLLEPRAGLFFVRISINAMTPAIARRHWGTRSPEEFIRLQLLGLHRLIDERKRRINEYKKFIPSIQVSVVLNKENIGDFSLICEAVSRVYRACGSSLPGDTLVARPMTDHSRSYEVDAEQEDVVGRILEVGRKDGDAERVLNSAGVKLALGFGLDRIAAGEISSYRELVDREYATRDLMWANGLFLTVGPDGGAYLNTEKNCQSEWKVGDLRTESVAEIYHGSRRAKVLERVHAARLGRNMIEPNSRASRLDRIGRAIYRREISDETIERFRREAHLSPPLLLS